MSIDFSSLSSDPLLYFLVHSTLFVVSIAATFFVFGLAFGWLTWGRYKHKHRDLLAEGESFKDEIATLKRKLAEQVTRASSLAESQPHADEPRTGPAHGEPDSVINSFLNTAAAILPQATGRDVRAPEPEPAPEDITTPPPAREPASSAPAEAKAAAHKHATTSRAKPKKDVLHSRIKKETGHELIDHAGGDAILPHIPESAPPSVEEPESSAAPVLAAEIEPLSQQSPSGEPGAASRLMSDPHLGLIYAGRPGLSDDLSHLKGVAATIERKLNDYGVYTYKQIALWSEENIREFSTLLAFKDRIHREQWVEQARELHFQKYGERL